METDDPKFLKRVWCATILFVCTMFLLTSCNDEQIYIHWLQQQRFVIKTVDGRVYNEWCDCHIRLNNVPSRRDSINCYTPGGDTLNEYDLGYKPLPEKMAQTK